MALTIAFFNQKGGCGKSTSAMQIGGELAVRGHRVAIVDMDLQGTSITWSGQGTGDAAFPATVFSLASISENIWPSIAKHNDNYDFIIIDCPPAIASKVPWNVLRFVDLGVMTTMPVKDNVWATEVAKTLATLAQKENKKLKIRILGTRVPRGKIYQLILDELRDDQMFPMYSNYLSEKIVYAESQLYGTCISKYAPKSTAAKEIRAVTDEILDSLLGE